MGREGAILPQPMEYSLVGSSYVKEINVMLKSNEKKDFITKMDEGFQELATIVNNTPLEDMKKGDYSKGRAVYKSQAKELAKDAEEIDLTPEGVEINMRTTNMVDVIPDSKRGVPLEFMVGKTKHFRNGNYETRDEKYANVLFKGNIYEFYDIVGAQFNQLKGKLYNLIESIGVTDKQERALKGLIKDFCNAKYKNTCVDIEGWVNRMGFDIGDTALWSANPLESRSSECPERAE